MGAIAGGLMLTCGAGTASAASQVTLAFNPQISQMIIIGEADSEIIRVSESGGTITITDAGPGGITTAAPCTALPPDTVTCPRTPPGGPPVAFLIVVLQGADDSYVNQNLAVPLGQVVGGSGNDVLETGPGDEVVGGDEGNDRLLAGPGDDELIYDLGRDEMNGGPGVDLADFGNVFSGGIQTSFDGAPNDGPMGEGDNLIEVEGAIGTLFSDFMRGDAKANLLDGEEGDDVITGGRGNDDLQGDQGDDHLTGGASSDGARDHLRCGPGFDVALIDARDLAEPDCERSGATIASDSAKLGRKGRVRVRVACPAEEAAKCRGRLALFLNGRRLSEGGKFKVSAGRTARGTIRLKRSGRKKVRRADGPLSVTVRAKTTEPRGSSTSEASVLLSS